MCITFYFCILYFAERPQVIYLSRTHITTVHRKPALSNKNLSSTERPKDGSADIWLENFIFIRHLDFPSFPQNSFGSKKQTNPTF